MTNDAGQDSQDGSVGGERKFRVDYDTAYKEILQDTAQFRQLLGILAGDDLGKYALNPAHEAFRAGTSDLVFEARTAENEIYFQLLLELQSGNDNTMPFRLFRYMYLITERVFNDGGNRDARGKYGFRLPAVVPIVFHNGYDKWKPPVRFRDYLAYPDVFKNNVIDFEYLFMDVRGFDFERYEGEWNLVYYILRVNQLWLRADERERADACHAAIENARTRLHPGDHAKLRDWYYTAYLRSIDRDGKLYNELRKGEWKKLSMDINVEAEHLLSIGMERGMEQGMERGMAEGRMKAKRETALNLLRCNVSPEIITKTTGLSLRDLESLGKSEM